MSMAAGEFVSVSSQADLEAADLARERHALKEDPHEELAELTSIYEERGLDPALARKVAEQLTAKDALAAHARDELGLTDEAAANPVLAALRLGRGVLRRRRPADAGGFPLAGRDHDRGRLRRGPDLSRRARRARRVARRGAGRPSGAASWVLGRDGDGGHRRNRRAGRQGGLATRATSHLRRRRTATFPFLVGHRTSPTLDGRTPLNSPVPRNSVFMVVSSKRKCFHHQRQTGLRRVKLQRQKARDQVWAIAKT